MDALIKLLKNATKLNADKVFINVVRDKNIQTAVLNFNRLDQLFLEGKDADDQVIGAYSSKTEQLTDGEAYTFLGRTKSKIFAEPIFLYDTGGFYSSFRIKIERDGFYIVADTIVDDGSDLTERYGEQILGLTDDSLIKLAKEIYPLFIEEVRRQLFQGVNP